VIGRVATAAQAAGRVIEAIRARGFDVARKERGDPVTEADHAADALLRRELLALERCGWLSEETADDANRLGQRRTWIVDPLDGTREFLRGIPDYSVAVALVEDRRPVLAVVHVPATGVTYHAERGAGAFRDGVRLRVQESSVLLASRSEMRRGEFAPFADWSVRPLGSIEHKLALVASGEAGVTLSRGPKWEWDVCAGSLLVEEAGGKASDLGGNPLRFNQPDPRTAGILAGAPGAYDRALAHLAHIGPSERMGGLGEAPAR